MEVQDLEQIVRQREGALSTAFPALMRKVYVWMALALVITGVCAFGVASSPHLLTALYSSRAAIWVLLIAETTLFVIYSALNGVTLSSIFLVYTMTSITEVFFISAGTFGAMALYGYVTKTNLPKIGNILFMALIGLIIASVVNMFLRSSGFDLILSYIGVLLFVGLTAWDSQRIKQALAMQPDMSEASQKIALLGALELYLDFINLFLYLLRIFGKNNN